jgi:chromosomal replication initiator protein
MGRNHIQVWESCLRIIKESIGDQSFNTWFVPIVPLRLQNDILTIKVPSQFFYEWLEEHYVNVLRKAIVAELGNSGKLEYSIIVDNGSAKSKPFTINLPTSKTGADFVSESAQNSSKPYINPFESKPGDINKSVSNLNTAFTFDNYIEGDCNKLARSAAISVANKPGSNAFNPLMIYGNTGLGKTHLLHAIGNQIKKYHPEKFVVYMSLDRFTNQFVDALRNNNSQAFFNYFIQVDCLIIDDIHMLSHREKTQDIFFNIFNELHQAHKQIILTSDRKPADLDGIDDRLLSRFKWGLTADVRNPDLETKIAIIYKKAEQEGVQIPHPVAEYIAYSVNSHVRDLEGVLNSVIFRSTLQHKHIDLELAKEALQHVVNEIESEVGIDYIQKVVAEYFKVTPELLKAKTRKKEVVEARQIAMYFAKRYTNLSLKSIGYHFGGRDHSTVIHAITTIEDLYGLEKRTRNHVNELQNKFKSRLSSVGVPQEGQAVRP